jgi:hypothetical protein
MITAPSDSGVRAAVGRGSHVVPVKGASIPPLVCGRPPAEAVLLVLGSGGARLRKEVAAEVRALLGFARTGAKLRGVQRRGDRLTAARGGGGGAGVSLPRLRPGEEAWGPRGLFAEPASRAAERTGPSSPPMKTRV